MNGQGGEVEVMTGEGQGAGVCGCATAAAVEPATDGRNLDAAEWSAPAPAGDRREVAAEIVRAGLTVTREG